MNRSKPLFATKAETLAFLTGKLSTARVPRLMYFSVAEWKRDPEFVLAQLKLRFPREPAVAVRSSTLDEHRTLAHAGRYRTCLNVPTDPRSLRQAIEKVLASYEGSPRDQILVQEMVRNAAISGVIFTHDLETGAPYYRIEYDDELYRTDVVTTGSARHKTVLVHSRAVDTLPFPKPIVSLLEMTRELESLWDGMTLSIEFTRSRKGRNFVLQVRPIPSQKDSNRKVKETVDQALHRLESLLERSFCPKSGLAGQSTILAQMSDWNPAELIGPQPRPLASSLFHHLISKSAWQEARSEVGYRAVPRKPLVVLLAGRPFVDVRLSFNSFLPADLSFPIRDCLVDAWLERLRGHPHYHDRVEFEVAQTAVDFTFDEDFRNRYGGVLSGSEFDRYAKALLQVTNSAFSLRPTGSLQKALAMIDQLAALQREPRRLEGLPLPGRLFHLLRECVQLGSRPFAVIARHAFIAEALLRSAVRRGVWTPERCDSFRCSIKTVASCLSKQFAQALKGLRSHDDFLRTYGHLRPGTFDIESRRYDQRPDLFRSGEPPSITGSWKDAIFRPTRDEVAALSTLIRERRLELSPEELFLYARRALQGREQAKFVFSRHLSDVLEGIASWAGEIGLNRGEASFLTLEDLESFSQANRRVNQARQCIAQIRRRQELLEENRGLRLGYIIRDRADLYRIPLQDDTANFVTEERVEAQVFQLDNGSSFDLDLFRKIVCIESADPGFDWIFTRGIAGLITKFGGANSHMAIRCAELRVAAAIGVGDNVFNRLLRARAAELNCKDRKVYPLYA